MLQVSTMAFFSNLLRENYLFFLNLSVSDDIYQDGC